MTFGSVDAFGVMCMRLPTFSFLCSLATDEQSREKMSWCKPKKQRQERRGTREEFLHTSFFFTPFANLPKLLRAYRTLEGISAEDSNESLWVTARGQATHFWSTNNQGSTSKGRRGPPSLPDKMQEGEPSFAMRITLVSFQRVYKPARINV